MSAIRVLDAETFEQFTTDAAAIVVVDFWAPWCSPCARFLPVMESVAAKWIPDVAFGKVNVDDAPDLARRYQIRGIPTLLLFKGGKLHDTHVGALTGSELSDWLGKANDR